MDTYMCTCVCIHVHMPTECFFLPCMHKVICKNSLWLSHLVEGGRVEVQYFPWVCCLGCLQNSYKVDNVLAQLSK